MAISLDNYLGVQSRAIQLRTERSEILASNIANADTPGYKAKDFDFKAAMTNATRQYSSSLKTTSENHIQGHSMINDGLSYRNPTQADTGDGNTVEVQAERNEFLQNQLRYNASVQFITDKITGLKKAITGGQA